MEDNFKKEISNDIDENVKSILSRIILESDGNDDLEVLVEIIYKHCGCGVVCDIIFDYEESKPKEYTYLWNEEVI